MTILFRFVNVCSSRLLLAFLVFVAGLSAGHVVAFDRTAANNLADQILDGSGVAGGLIIHLGCGDSALTASLYRGDNYVVAGLERGPEQVKQARQRIQSLGIYGPVTVNQLKGNQLPYIDNLANLVVVEEREDVPMREVMRVLAPLGVAYIQENGRWTKHVKSWPANIDQWTHYLHGPDNNAVANDTVVAPPRGLQWVGGPRWSRAHSTLNGTSCMASARGRIFTIEDRAPVELPLMPGKYTLVARDAFNGIVLWKRHLKNWENITHWMKPTPVQLTRRLVAVGDRVYATLGIFGPVTALDAATGEVVRVYEQTEETQEIICCDDVLYLVTGDRMNPYGLTQQRAGYRPQYAVFGEARYSPRRLPKDNPRCSLVAVDADSGEVLWERTGEQTAEYQATTLAVRGDMLVYQTKSQLIRVDQADGRTVWEKEIPIRMKGSFKLGGSSPTLVLTDEVILRADSRDLVAFSASDGHELWRTPTTTTYFSSPDIFVVGNVVWPYPSTQGHDLLTGEVVASRRVTRDRPMGHDRCYRNKATVNYMINSRSGGADFSRFDTDFSRAHPWVRGTCSLGVMPCNGLLYASPHACSCVNEAKLNGFYALSGTAHGKQKANVLEKGPAYEEPVEVKPEAGADEWPTYRQRENRCGKAETDLAKEMEPLWEVSVGNPTPPVIAAGKLLVADTVAHTVQCFDSANGQSEWTFTAGGGIDSPPTYAKGRVIFGTADGWVYCLRGDSGKLVWKFRAAPQAKQTVSFGQLESLWPVHGSVLVLDDTAYFAAGRQSFIDGGVYLYGLDIGSGRVKYERQISGPYGADGESVFEDSVRTADAAVKVFNQIKGTLSDILVSDGELVFLRHMAFHHDLSGAEKEKNHLLTVSGFLDAAGHHRSYWTVAPGLIYDTRIGDHIDADLLVMDGPDVFGTRISASNRGPEVFDPRERGFKLFSVTHDPEGAAARREHQIAALTKKGKKLSRGAQKRLATLRKSESPFIFNWDIGVPVNGKAMLKAGDRLFVAGTPGKFPEDDLYQAVEGKCGGVLIIFSTADGKPSKAYRLEAPPVWDGMAAANERLFMALKDNRIQCWGARRE